MKLDLHLHTDSSDGAYPAEEVVSICEGHGLDVISITDHDSITGTQAAVRKAEGRGIRAIRGVECSTVHADKEVHILGYFPGEFSGHFQQFVSLLQQDRKARIAQGLKKLNSAGVEISDADVGEYARGDVVGRLHVAKALIRLGYSRTVTDAFDGYLKYDLGFFRRTTITVGTAAQEINSAGGVAIWAHPHYKMLDKADEFIKEGVAGIEVFNRRKGGSRAKCHAFAKERGIFLTAGSDWHGMPEEEAPGKFDYDVKETEPFLKRLLG